MCTLFSKRLKWNESGSVMSDSLGPHGQSTEFSRNTGVSSCSLLQKIFPTQGSNMGIQHCRQILYQLSHQGSPRMLAWVAYPFCRGSSQPRNRARVSCIEGRAFTNGAVRDPKSFTCSSQQQFFSNLNMHKIIWLTY